MNGTSVGFIAIVVGVVILGVSIAQTPKSAEPTPAVVAKPKKPPLVEYTDSSGSAFYHYRDRETGCEYFFRGSLTPRLGADGKPLCKGATP